MQVKKQQLELDLEQQTGSKSGKEYNAGELGLIPGLGRFPWRRAWQPTPVFLPGEFHGQRTLVDCSPWGRKESDTTEATNTLTFIFMSKNKTNSGALYFCKLWFLDLL